jgi:hypothetical protein
MSFRSVAEVLVHFESFRNIDLYHQGIYFLRCCLYYQKGEKFYYAQPFTIFNAKLPSNAAQVASSPAVNQPEEGEPALIGGVNPAKTRKRKNLDHHNILPASIDKENFKFNTRAYMIRYCEEEVELNDIIHFRLEIDTDQDPTQK